MRACEKDYVEEARYLLDRGADFKIKDSRGRTALQIACVCASEEMIKLLITRGSKMITKLR